MRRIRETLPETTRHTAESAGLAERLRMDIRDGEYRPDAPLPPQRKLCIHYRAGLRTVRRAIAALEREGMVRTAPRRGVFVTGRACAGTIRVIVPNVISPDHAEMVAALSAECLRRGMKMTLTTVEEGRWGENAFAFERRMLEDLDAKDTAGVIKAPTSMGDRDATLRAILHEKGIPCVFMNDFYTARDDGHHVLVSERDCAELLAERLASLGHRRLLFFSSDGDPRTALREALETAFARRVGVEATVEAYCAGRLGEKDVEILKGIFRRATAVVASNYPYAVRILDVLARLKMSVPEDISMACAGSAPRDPQRLLDLTCCRAPVAAMAGAALDALTTPEDRRLHVVFRPSLHAGQSTASPPGSAAGVVPAGEESR